ncbi:MAG TPA: hypothetical protein V6D10_12535 [Trichocoleus sp.]|jgi:hypothetical protein
MTATRVNLTVVLTLILLTLMVGAGLTSATWGYKTGREALKGITQPDARPVNNMMDGKGKPIKREGLTFLKEEDILKNVKAKIDAGSGGANAN